MKSFIFSYRNKKVVTFQYPKFYKIKSKKDLDKLVNKLLDVDAVFHPEFLTQDFKNTIYLELKDGFGITLLETTYEEIKKRFKKTLKRLK